MSARGERMGGVRLRTVAAAAVLAALAGCAGCDTVPPDAVTDCNAQIVPGSAATDILFVIDDSGSMTPKQEKLAAELGTFIDQLLSSAIALDVNIGVTNTSVDEYGADASTFGATAYSGATFPGPRGTPYPAGAIEAIWQDPSGVGSAAQFLWGSVYDPVNGVSTWGGPRILSSGSMSHALLAQNFKANVLQGRWGSGKEQPLRAMALALKRAGAGGLNFPFQRAGARLAVVILTDEDDCSDSAPPLVTSDATCHNSANWGQLDPLPDYISTLTELDTEPIVAVIGEYVGTTPQVCETGPFPSGPPAPPARLDKFLSTLDPSGTHSLRASLCDAFGPTLLKVAQMIIPQTLPLKQSPADPRMMVVSVVKPSGTVVACPMQPAGSAAAGSAGVVYTPAPPGGYPTLTFQNACHLDLGDKIDIKILCAG